MKISKISEEVKEIFKKTAKKLSDTTKREYIATITIELLDGNARKAEACVLSFICSMKCIKRG